MVCCGQVTEFSTIAFTEDLALTQQLEKRASSSQQFLVQFPDVLQSHPKSFPPFGVPSRSSICAANGSTKPNSKSGGPPYTMQAGVRPGAPSSRKSANMAVTYLQRAWRSRLLYEFSSMRIPLARRRPVKFSINIQSSGLVQTESADRVNGSIRNGHQAHPVRLLCAELRQQR